MKTYFISDLHLTPARQDITQCFLDFMRNEAIDADAVYVLGDLFEFWVGDDDNSDFANSVRSVFKSLTSSGIPCYFTQGNRDFLVGKKFAKQTGITLLDEVSTIDIYGKQAVVLHGDTLCTDDVKYLAFREKVHQPWLQ
ncbi:UDP-2,3-diacylglucosamine diphosphatase, partial [Vibrio makurazakiensis]|uniref:UDP-2,3-diacylglucosamine diphosphatase n=1 Tax=Vibrio makurazakiensis TaxID=2910250 RepID=UPI003D111F4D